jgi:hypothetical protein
MMRNIDVNDADADPTDADQEEVAQAFAELDKLTLMAERLTEARKKAENASKHVTTPNEIRTEMIRGGLPTDGVDFEKIARLANDDSRYVPGWEAPRKAPASWYETARSDRGVTVYVNAQRSLKVILSCSIEDDGRAWLHMSVSHRTKRTPTHGEVRICKEAFLGDRYAYSVPPPRKMYVNINEVLHLFALLDENAGPALPEFSAGTGSI